MDSRVSAKVTLWCCRFLAAVVMIMIFAFPAVMGWFRNIRELTDQAVKIVTSGLLVCRWCFLRCAPWIGW